MSSINQLSPSIRDDLLKRNLILPDIVEENSLGGYASGVGRPASIGDGSSSVQQGSSDAKTFREKIMGLNPYGSKQSLEVDIQPIKNQGQVGGQSSTSSQKPYSHSDAEGDNSLEGESQQYRSQNTTYNPYQPDYGYQGTRIHLKNVEDIGNLDSGSSPSQYRGPSGDIRNRLASRTLTPVVQGDDTLIGQLGDDYRSFHLLENIATNAQEETVGRINTNPVSLLTGNDFIRPNFSITVPKGKFGKAIDLGSRILGFEVPTSQLSSESSIFYSENPVNNVTRANSMLDNSGEGQVVTLINTMDQNKYKPGYSDSRSHQGIVQAEKGSNHNIYVKDLASSDGTIKDVLAQGDSNDDFNVPIAYTYRTDFNSEFDDIKNDAERNIEGFDGDFAWVDDNHNKAGKVDEPKLSDSVRSISAFRGPSGRMPIFTNPDSILSKTETLFATDKMKTLTSGKGLASDDKIDPLTSHVGSGGQKLISKGSGVMSQDALDTQGGNQDQEGEGGSPSDPSQVFCRTWTTFDRYDQVWDLQKHSGFKSYKGLFGDDAGMIERNEHIAGSGPFQRAPDYSVLDEHGFARIGPRKDESLDVKRFMLSIENLAWSEYTSNLPAYEVGPGDPDTGTKGRIMWFPPYEISVDDNVSVSWDNTNFIGRGEPIYTYNNTERILTLGFKVIIDYPSYLDYVKDAGNDGDENFEEKIRSAIAGCYNISDLPKNALSPEERDKADEKNSEQAKQEKTDDEEISDKFNFSVFFPNAYSTVESIPSTYEDGTNPTDPDNKIKDGDFFTNKSDDIKTTPSRSYTEDFSKNYEWFNIKNNNNNKKQELIDFLKEGGQCENCNVLVKGVASKHGKNVDVEDVNTKLAEARRDSVKQWIEENIIPEDGENEVQNDGVEVQDVPNPSNPEDGEIYSETAIMARKVIVKFEPDTDSKESNEGDPKNTEESGDNSDENRRISKDVLKRLLSERQYFEKMKEEDKFVYETLQQKLKYFHPSFHSTTPEGFNARLNFLHQCTRQGRTDALGGARTPNNLAFGRPPICILRVGDFFNTKVAIDNVNISFDPMQWDLNPEGVGVQPMIATVHLSMKAIGGSSLKGPINVLQNAISYNFFANTEIYEPKALRIKGDNDPKKETTYERKQDIHINKENQRKPDDSSEDGTKGTKSEESKDQEEGAEEEGKGVENAGNEGGGDFQQFLNDSIATFNQNKNRLEIRFGKKKTYDVDSNKNVKVKVRLAGTSQGYGDLATASISNSVFSDSTKVKKENYQRSFYDAVNIASVTGACVFEIKLVDVDDKAINSVKNVNIC